MNRNHSVPGTLKTIVICFVSLLFIHIVADIHFKCWAGGDDMRDEGNRAFQVYEGELDGRPLIVVIDKSYSTFNAKEKYPWFLSISTPLINANEKGLPNKQDADALDQFEDNIENELKKTCSSLFIGRVTCNGYRELLFYIDNPKKVADTFQSLINGKKFRPFAFQCEEDNKWERVSAYFR